MNIFPVDVVRRFNGTDLMLYRAFDHLIGSRKGMTLMVPVVASSGKLDDLVDQCPVPLLEASAILEADYEASNRLNLNALVSAPLWQKIKHFEPLAEFGKQLVSSFVGPGGICSYDENWRHVQIRLNTGGEPCRVLIGESGVRLAFTPDFFEGML